VNRRILEIRAETRPDWRPHHPETEPAWECWAVIIEGLLTYTEVEQLPLERIADAWEACLVAGDVKQWHSQTADV
jgi:hypothetical protein